MFSGYGYFIDEFYYIACSKRLAFGYVDHPPLSIVLLAINRWLLGDSIQSIRFLPAISSAATVWMTGIITRRLGGNRTAVTIAALAATFMPVYLVMGSFYSMNAFEPLIWSLISWLVVRTIQEEHPRYLLWAGILMGIGLEMKHTIIVYGVTLAAGLLLAPARRHLWNRYVLAGVIGSFLLILPNLIWQYLHDFPTLEFYRNALLNKNIPRSPAGVILDQMLLTNPIIAPVWLIGWVSLFISHDMNKYRCFAWASLGLLVIMILSHSSRPDRIGAMYIILFAAGATVIAKTGRIPFWRWITAATITAIIGGGIMMLPISTPLLPPAVLSHYMKAIGFSIDLEEGKKDEPIPQWLADRLGWRELAADVAAVYHSMPQEEQMNAVLVSTNYGEAGALELFGSEFGLPPVYATHNSFHSWGHPSDSVRTYILVFVNTNDVEEKFEQIEESAVHECEHCTRPQRRIPIYIARGPRFSITKEWPSFKTYN